MRRRKRKADGEMKRARFDVARDSAFRRGHVARLAGARGNVHRVVTIYASKRNSPANVESGATTF